MRDGLNLRNKLTPHVKDKRQLLQTLNEDWTNVALIFPNKTKIFIHWNIMQQRFPIFNIRLKWET